MQNKILAAGMELIKGNFDGAVKSLTYSQPLIPTTYRGNDPIPQNQWHFWSPGFQNEFGFDFTNSSSAWAAYKLCSPLSSIINRKSRADLNGKRFVMKPNGKEATSDVADKIRKLLRRPNLIQNNSQFFTQFKIYMELYDYCIVFCQPPAGMDRTNASSMWILPPQHLKIKQKQFIPYKVKSITDVFESIVFCVNGNEYPLDLNTLFFFSTGAACETGIIPTNKVQLLSEPITNIISAMNSRKTLIRRRGALGIISPKSKDGTGAVTIPLKPTEKEQLQREWRGYGTQSDQNNIVISNASIDWTRITMDVGELKLMEEVVDSSKMLCDGLGYPPHLLGLIDPTFNNQNAAEKGLYQNTIIPERQTYDDQWNEFFNAEEYKLNISTDYSHLPVLQEDKVQLGDFMFRMNQSLLIQFQNNIITFNEWRVGADLDPIIGMDIYYSDMVQQGKIFGAQPNVPKEQGANSNQSNNGTANNNAA